MERKAVRVGIVACHEWHGAIHESGQESYATGQPVAVGHDKRSFTPSSMGQRSRQRGTIRQLAGSNLGIPTANAGPGMLGVAFHRGGLGFNAEAALALSLGAHAQVTDD